MSLHLRRIFWLVLVVQLSLFGCATQTRQDSLPMNQPLQFESSAEFYRALQSLETRISESDYQRLTDAIGHLQAYDLENLHTEDFHATLAGMTPRQIIEAAEREGD